ncbi:MAG: hypothetical protein CVV32_02845 [Methanomicrobiales archaeon HGW-Methanomicrobiales-3]|jgi:hypothetical protein|nr:MAG: hypothetical protein CVV32_02845 [Methanomicrobiales archaeon HGW-Methanomicrobiales-3]
MVLGIFDEIDKAMKKVEAEVKKANLDKSFKDIGNGITRAGNDISQEVNKTPPSTRTPHPGYSRIAAWMKVRCKGKISTVSGTSERNLELELIAAEATSGLSAKTKKGFLDYLKSQNYEQLLK